MDRKPSVTRAYCTSLRLTVKIGQQDISQAVVFPRASGVISVSVRGSNMSDWIPVACYHILGRIECMRCGHLRLMILASVSLYDTRVGCAKTAERIDVLFGMETSGNRRNIDEKGERCPHPHSKWEGVRCGLRQITLTTCQESHIGLLLCHCNFPRCTKCLLLHNLWGPVIRPPASAQWRE